MKEMQGIWRNVDHLDEHTLELYILQAGEVAGERRRIARHLRICPQCRSLQAEIIDFYSRLDNEVKTNHSLGKRQKTSLIRRVPDRENVSLYDEQPSPHVSLTRTERLQQFIGRNAIAFGATTFGIILVLATLLLIKTGPNGSDAVHTDTNPAELSWDGANQTLNVLNEERQKLWSLRYHGESDSSSSLLSNIERTTVLKDLDGDGKNELITGFGFLQYKEDYKDVLQVYSSSGKRLVFRRLGRNTQYRGQNYPAVFYMEEIVVDAFERGGPEEILAGIGNRYSPYLLLRMDAAGNELGEFWHYGHMFSAYLTTFEADSSKNLVLCGVEDQSDPLGRAVIIVLDPHKLKGKCESTYTAGFGATNPTPELYYVRFRRTELDNIMLAKPRALARVFESKDEIAFYVGNDSSPATYSFEYRFSKKDFHLIDVKTNDMTRRLVHRLFEEGKTKLTLDDRYLKSLAEGVEYWDGKGWKMRTVSVGKSEGRKPAPIQGP